MYRSGFIAPVTSGALSLLLFFTANPAAAQQARAEGWRFSVGSYLWMSSIDGDRTLQPPAAPVQFGGSSLFGGGSSIGLSAEVGKGRWSMIVDGVSVAASDEVGSPGAEATGSAGRWDLRLDRADAMLGRRLGSAGDATGFEVLGGIRYTRLRQDFRGGSGESLGLERRWIDPMIEARFVSRPDNGIGFVTSWELGGFGIGSALSWGLETGLIFQWSDAFDLTIGYRLSDVDYEQNIGRPNAFVYNGTVRGLRSQLSFNF